MRSPSIAPQGFDSDVYLVLDDLGPIGRSYREIDETEADRETVIRDLKNGQYLNPVRVVCFNTAQGTSRDATTEIAQEIKDRSERKGEELSPALEEFIENELGRAKRMARI